ncbi:hypothetical protein [Peristeroidobacter agariperforans]|uniref:hypothetical protein n=1 Tax=Peristeroidobacter agariperforans TaxID=268404 RepID=UPI00101D28D4|nr:hypothetical protein [Peristeroidobacter agariperforans]
MRTSIYIVAAVAMAGFATADAQNTGNRATPSRTETPVRQPTTSPPAATPMPSPQTSPTPAQPTQPNRTEQMTPNSPAARQETVRPPDSRRTREQNDNRLNPANNQERVPPTSRGIGTSGKPDCSKLRGIEKSECERRDTTRDDLPAGVTTKQPEK